MGEILKGRLNSYLNLLFFFRYKIKLKMAFLWVTLLAANLLTYVIKLTNEVQVTLFFF